MVLRPFGEDTLIVPCRFEGRVSAPIVARMSRLRPRGELFRGGIAPAVEVGGDTGRRGLLAQYAPASPIPLLPPMFIPGSADNKEFVRSTIAGAHALRDWLGTVLESRRPDDKPPPGSKPINETPWSGDHKAIKGGMGVPAEGSVKISPNGDAWAENPDGSWTNHGPARNFTGSGRPSGQRGKDRRRNDPRTS